MATIKENKVSDRIAPAYIEDKDKGIEYCLDFTRESVKYAEGRGFELENVVKFPVTYFPEFFYLAFRAHHGPKNGNISRIETDRIFDSLGGLSPEFLGRLIDLYQQAQQSNNAVETTEEMGKNSHMTVRL